jgi:pyruvate/2-oxoglutarate dehydrogenase complex dihydrolipoamide dehydrogenase (E3) component
MDHGREVFLMNKYDVAIIGAGAGGLNSAFTAVSFGKKTVLIDKYKPGGECTWSGCIPSKALIQIAKDIKTAKKFAPVAIDSKAILKKVRFLVEEAHQHEAVSTLEEAGIEYINGCAKLKTANSIDVDGKEIIADHIIIATGSKPLVPSIQGIDKVNYLTNENVFQQVIFPEKLIVLGAGAIGVELSQAMQRLGVQVQLIEMADNILFREEKELTLAVQSILEEEGVQVHTSSKAVEVKEDSSGVTLIVEQHGITKEIKGDKILLSLGRKANVEGINLEEIGVKYNQKGIIVNEFNETSIRNIYAVGDVVGPYLFSHTAGYQARSLVKNLYSESKVPIRIEHVAWCTFIEPELARAGLTEAEARDQYGDSIKVYTLDYSDLDRAVVDEKTVGKAKVICNNEGLVLGASILGERACELLGELQLLKTNGIPFHRLCDTIHPYPGYSELLFSMSLEAVEQMR